MADLNYKTITSLEGQNLYNIAIQEYGCAEAVSLLREDNNVSLATVIKPGRVLKIRVPVPEITTDNRAVVNRLAAAGVFPATAERVVELQSHYVQTGYVMEGYVK